ncbi:hypothetical protein NDA13_005446, partial [Ustilago tritici]
AKANTAWAAPTNPSLYGTNVGDVLERCRAETEDLHKIHGGQVTDPSGERISEIKLTLTATQILTIPKSAFADAPSALDRMAIDPEEVKTKELTLLQLERVLFEPTKTKADRDANLLSPGKHAYPFSIELPLAGNKDKKNPPLLPTSCVIEPLLTGPVDAKLRQSSSGLFGRGKAKGKDQTRPAWATVKYQLKLTVQRPGILKRNIRSYAPFVYLPSPPVVCAPLLLQRRALGAQMAAIVLQRLGDGCQPIETPEDWRQRPLSFLISPNGTQKLEPEKKSGFLSPLFSGPKKQQTVQWHEAWTVSMPMSGCSSFPLRSAIPFVVRCITNKPIDISLASPLAFRLYRRVRLLSGKKQKAIAMQQEPVAEAALRFAVESRGVFRLNGIISLPPNCMLNFELNNLSLDYYVAVVRLKDGAVLHKEFVNLACPPPVEPKAPYGPYQSGLAWRHAQEAALQQPPDSPPSFDESPPLASRSVTSDASTDSAHNASSASSLGHGSAGAVVAGVPMGPAGLANPPPASSAGASGLGFAPTLDKLDPVREQNERYSSRGAAPIVEASPLATSSTDHSHSREKTAHALMARQESQQSASRAANSDLGHSRRGLFVANTNNLSGIPAKAAASTREHADALVGSSSKPSKSRKKRNESDGGASATGGPSAAVASSSRNERNAVAVVSAVATTSSQSRQANRPLPVTPAAPPPVQESAYVASPSVEPMQQSAAIDPAFCFTNDGPMYGEDMELDLPPSYFEAVYGAGEENGYA